MELRDMNWVTWSATYNVNHDIYWIIKSYSDDIGYYWDVFR